MLAALLALALVAGGLWILGALSGKNRAVADVGFSQNVQAVGEHKYVRSWTSYGPAVVYGVCGGRSGCVSGIHHWRVSRGTATTRLTTFKVTERIRAYDYYLLDVDVATSRRTGSGDGGTAVFRIHSSGPKLYDRNDSRSIRARGSSCTTVGVQMSTPWPIVTANATVGRATFCDKSADLRRSTSGADATYQASQLSDVRHLTMQRWVKVRAGRRPRFTVAIVLPQDRCTRGNGKGYCVRYRDGANSKAVVIGTTG